MKEYFYEKDNKTYIIDNKEGIVTRDAKDNMEETLIVENDIEKLENMLKTIESRKIFTEYSIKEEGKKQKILSVLIIILSILMFGISYKYITPTTLPLYIFTGIAVSAFPYVSIHNNKKLKNDLKGYNASIEQFDKELEKQKNKLNELNKVAKDKVVDSTIIKKIPNSELIDSLIKKRDLITDYFEHTERYISAYNSNELKYLIKNKNYSDSDVELLKFLIEQDINKKEKGYQKKYTN